MKILFVFGIGLLVVTSGFAQQSRRQRLDSLYTEPFQNPTVSAVLLPQGYVELNNTAALQTTNRLFNGESRPEKLNARVSTFSDLFQVTYGMSKSGRFNLGLDLLYNRFRVDLDPASAPWKVFGSDSALSQAGSFNTLGARFRWKPKGIPDARQFVVQGFLYQPIYKPRESQTSFRLQAVTVFDLGPYIYLYAQAGIGYAIPKNNLSGSLSLPVTAVLQYQLKPTVGLLGVMTHAMSFGKTGETSTQLTAFGTQLGAGLQVQPSLRIGVNVFYTRYLLGKNSGAFDTITLGIRSII